MTMTLKQAKKIAGRVGARIEERETVLRGGDYQIEVPTKYLEITIPGRSLDKESSMTIAMPFGATPADAAHRAVIATAQHAKRLIAHCQRVYIEEDLLMEITPDV